MLKFRAVDKNSGIRLVALVGWGAVSVIALCAAGLVALSTWRMTSGTSPERVRNATMIWIALLLASAVAFLLPRVSNSASLSTTNASSAGETSWWTALRLAMVVGILGMLAVGWFALTPPAIAASHYKAWDFVDKRWIAAAYLLAVGLVYLPGLIKRVLDGGMFRASTVGSWVTETDDPARPIAKEIGAIRRALIASVVGCLLAILYVGSIASPALTRQLDTHELVQLGGLQAIANGATPFLEARTQYGPGQQLLIYKLVRLTEMSVRGARLAHLLVNCAAIAVVFATMLFAFEWAVGFGMILLALFISPLQVTTFVGWGLIVRWLGPFLVGALVPRWLDASRSRGSRAIAIALLGAVCGVLAWVSQENGSTSVMTLMLVLSAAIIRQRMSVIESLVHTAAFVASVLATFLVLMLVQFGPSHLQEALALYRSGSGLVFAGFTNTAWTDANTHWTEPLAGRGPADHLFGWLIAGNLSGWRAAYFFTPVLLVTLAALALYARRRDTSIGDDDRVLSLLGMLAAAASLDLLTLFRADATHFVGMSLALAPMMVLAVLYLPARVAISRSLQTGFRIALVAAFVVIYPFLSANTEFRFAHLGRATEGIREARNLWTGQLVNANATLLTRLGYEPAVTDACCRSNKLTYADLARVMHDVHAAAAGRSVLVDTRNKYSALGPVASAVYFLGDLRVGTTFVEPMMSIWTDADIAAAEHDADVLRPACLLTGGSGFLLTEHVLHTFGSYSTHAIANTHGATLLCRN